MASIEKHISDLLCLHDCVIVPGFGGFVANHIPAAIQEERHLFLPPSKELGFNRSLFHNDGLLVNHLCRREGCSYQEGMEQISCFVSDLLLAIDRNEGVTLDEVGDFKKDSRGNLLFAPRMVSSFLPDAFGLVQFQFEPLENASLVRNSDEPVRRLLRSRSPRYWASVAAVMAGLFFFTSELKMPEQTQMNEGSFFSISGENQKTMQGEDVSNAYFTDVKSMGGDGSDESVELNTTIPSVSKEVAEPMKVAGVSGYHLIAASFSQSGPAQKVLNEMLGNGYPDARIIHGANGRFRVALCSFTNKSEALARLYQVRETPRFGEVWLLNH